MLRDLKFVRRNAGKNSDSEEPENVPVNGKLHESSVSQMGTDSSSRPPLNTIQEPVQNPSKRDQELGFKGTKIDRTPTKVNGSKHSESGMPMRTPEKQGGLARNRYGLGSDSRNEGKNVNMNTPRSCRTVGRAVSSGYSECNSTQNTPSKSVNKPLNPGLSHGASSRPPAGGGARINGNFAALSRGFTNSYATVNKAEVPHFDMKEDPSFWMDHSVQVLIRIRPLNSMEIATQGYNRCLKQESAQCLTWVGHPETRFKFDHVACETIDQETLFRMVGLPMVENCLSGYNSCIFAYGQTGSGKTHTMLGEINELEIKPSPYRGMTPRMFEFLFARILAEEESRIDERLTYNCKCSFLEIYNEQIADLLDPSSTNLQLREDVKKGVYVENLTEYEVHTVGDILRLLSRGSANRRVAATNMNRESSRSHSVFTCVIESRWEKDSTSNLRFARLNLVDLAGSERQKTSGAEGERLKEAANINKSLSTLGHVIMVLVDGANARTRHVPYRDSRLTFLLQDSLGGNSKTMIIANVSSSICSATETLNTLKFAQRAKLIQNNAVVNEDASGDVVALQHQIQLLKEELAILKRHNVSRSLTFGPEVIEETRQELQMDQLRADNMLGHENKILRVSSKQLKSLETSLTGALRREQMSETNIKQLEAEIQHLNRLVRQREEDNKCTKMMLKFREDKIHRMESLLAGSIPADSYLLEENNMLTEEIQMIRVKADRNPEVTRFALENIRLLEQLRRFQDFYEEGEREMLLTEVSELRNQLVLFLDENSKQNHMQKEPAHDNIENNSLQLELEKSQEELEKCRNNLNSCLERNAKLCREIADLNALLENQKSAVRDHGVSGGIEVIKEPILIASSIGGQSMHTIQKTPGTCLKQESILEDPVGDESSHTVLKNETSMKYIEDVMDHQLEVDILKIILKEERSSRGETEEEALCLSRDLKSTKEKCLLITKQYKDLKEELEEAKSVIEALETQQLISINELEDLRNSNRQYAQILDMPPSTEAECVQEKLNKMRDSLERARRTNTWYKTDRACHASNEEEMDEVRKQVEAETAEVIVCLQEELSSLQQQVHDGSMKERAIKLELTLLEEKLKVMTECNETLREKHEGKERQLNSLSKEWDFLTNEIEEALTMGHEELEDASNHLDAVTVYEQLQMITRSIFEKESRIKELNSCLEDARNKGNEMEDMLRALRGATLVMAEAHQHDCSEKDQVIRQLSSQLSEKSHTITQLHTAIKQMEEKVRKASVCATGAFVIVNRFSEIKDSCLVALAQKEAELNELKNGHMVRDCRSSRDTGRRDGTIILLKKELETALGSLNGVKTEMARLRSEKEAVLLSEKQNCKSIEVLVPQVLTLQSVFDKFEKQIGVAMVSLDHKIQTVEELLQESCKSCIQKRKLYELELMDAKVNAAQQAAESSCVRAKFAEAQYTIKEADVMINELLIAIETMKLDIEALKRNEVALMNERDMHKENYEVLGQRFETDTMGMKKEVEELEDMILQIQSSVDEDLLPTASDFFCMKSQLHDSSTLIQSWLEDIWSEIIAKDCAVSVLRVCHMEILLQTVTGLNAENGLLYHGLRESNSLVSQLREHNCKSRKELEMCRVLQGKLLSDIKNSFDRVLRSTEETGLFSVKLDSFEEKILNLQLLEEAMLERSNYMGSELCALVKEMETMDKEEELISIEEKSMVDLLAKEIELLIVSSKLKQMDSQRNDLEKENNMVLENLKEKIIVCNVDMQLKESILLDKEAEVAFLHKDLKAKEKALEVSMDRSFALDQKSRMLEMSSCKLQKQLEIKNTELREMRLHEEEMKAEYCAVSQELEETKTVLKRHDAINSLSSKECINLLSTVDMKSNRVFSLLSERVVSLEQRFEEINRGTEKICMVVEEFECLEILAKEVASENFNFKTELDRKDEVLEGLVFDLRLLQESSSNKQDEIEELAASLEALENELDKNEKVGKISILEADVSRESELVKSLFSEIQMLTENVKDALKAKEMTEAELAEVKKANESLEMELVQLETALDEMKTFVESRTSDYNTVSCKRDALHSELLDVRKELDMAQALAEENEAIATEAKQMAETSRQYAQEKEEEVKLYEKSVEELECIVNVLESQVDMVKGDAERQRLQREELELEFHAFKQQIHSVKSSDLDMKSHLNEKEKCLQEVLQRVQILEKEIATKDIEIVQHKAHINELNLHAEAQAREFKQTFKTLGAMADQVKPDASAPHVSNSPSKKLERNGSRTRGSGSPFKCIGIGLAQQMKSEKDEELAAARHKIEELEALAASRQKEIFTLNAKLAMSGSMTHDVLRDLLGIKLDMTTYSLLVDGHQIEEITEKRQIHDAEGQLKEEEVSKLKQQLNELVMERKGWLEEIERKQAEIVAAQVLLEQLRQRDRLLTTENEIFKTEISNHKMKAIELEAEVKKLSGQQNLQQRIHHHTKIKEENNTLKTQNDELSRKLRKTDVILCRVKEELASLRAASGINSNYVETELKLNTKLKEKEEERDQLAQKLAALYTSILKAAGVTRLTSDVSVSAAEEALEHLQSRVNTLEKELQDLQYKNRISNERIRLFELMPQMGEENRQTNNNRASSRSPFLSTLDR
ncbi:kinesin-like protein KIN-12D [Cynara cardunculus var. scolymus]|uniref:kinesin-like protein KIN-12D n=1 Tax=Cynara cardunculus var. scolymus TaxID=59895 RepID=UPI000D631534|nr:kinesin-like protein KIN-12D [Cynara cardunculus var. scolymus]